MRPPLISSALIVTCLIQFFCTLSSAASYDPYSVLNKKTRPLATSFRLWSPSFSGGAIPPKHTCDGSDLSPQLEWSEPPLRAKSYALICDEVNPKGKVTSRWVMYRIPVRLRKLKEGVPRLTTLDDGTKQGINDEGKTGYSGPCPPAGRHKYIFTIFALDTTLIGAQTAMNKEQLFKSMRNHVLEQAHLVGDYQR